MCNSVPIDVLYHTNGQSYLRLINTICQGVYEYKQFKLQLSINYLTEVADYNYDRLKSLMTKQYPNPINGGDSNTGVIFNGVNHDLVTSHCCKILHPYCLAKY